MIKYEPDFYSRELKNRRDLIIYLPPDYYNNPNLRYPVLYMHDGNNLFDARTSFSGVKWGVDDAADSLITENKLQQLIIVGIYNTPDRISEYSPFADNERGGGNGDAYLSFIVESVKQFIDEKYRTLTNRENTGIAGSSLGGLISLYASIKFNDIFGLVGAVSPAIYWSNLRIIDYLKDSKLAYPFKIWFDMGTDEGEDSGILFKYKKAIQHCRLLKEAIDYKNCISENKITYHYEEIENAKHNEKYWAERIDRILLYLFGK